jgi:hypothetical protein
MAQPTRHELTQKQQQQLSSSIRGYVKWLQTKVNVRGAEKYRSFVFPNPTQEDKLMWLDPAVDGAVYFNTYNVYRSSFEFYRMVVLHECFHLYVQDVPNKEDAKRVKDDFGDVIMKLLDIEADYYTALYYKERRKASLVDIFSLYYQGSRMFGDPKIRVTKLERFIGAVLSIANVFLAHPEDGPVEECDLYLPTVSNIPTEDSMHILIARKSHFVLSAIYTNYQDLYEMKKCYTSAGEYTLKGYVERLIRFATKALGQPMPDEALRELEGLKSVR